MDLMSGYLEGKTTSWAISLSQRTMEGGKEEVYGG